MARKPGEWQTPVAYMKNRQQMIVKLENSKILEPMDLENEISYFNNPRAKGHTAAFDLFFAYTKTFPLYDRRKGRDDRKYLPDLRENFYQQEERKAVPVLTSMVYGRRPFYDAPSGVHKRRKHIANFYSKRQIFSGEEKQRYTEDINFNI